MSRARPPVLRRMRVSVVGTMRSPSSAYGVS
jgi:hypothetical protein